jgi:ABC-type transport system involved in multi-copper enzyme maturation permease subunit
MGVLRVLKLIKLELKKFPIANNILAAFIANIVILGFMTLISLTPDIEIPFADYNEVFFTIDLFVRGTFTIFAAVLLSKYVLSEFRSKSISVLFMYPVSRKKLMLAKLLIVVIFTGIFILLSNLIIGSLFYVLNQYLQIVPQELTQSVLVENLIGMVTRGIATSGMCLIPLYFGMRKYSTATTILTSFLIVLVVCSNNMGFSLSSIIAIPITMGIVGAVIAYFTIKRVDNLDLN